MPHPPQAPVPAGVRRWTAAAAMSAVVLAAALTLAPRGLVAPARALFLRLSDAAVPAFVEGMLDTDADRVLNMLLFVPLGVTLALLLGRRLWPVAILAGSAVSAAVESAQEAIPGRVPDLEDVAWNTLGAATGAIAVGVAYVVLAVTRWAWRSRWAPHSQQRPAE